MADKRKSYQAFLRVAKRKYELPHAKAQKLYRDLSKRLDKPAKAADLKKHPRISKQEADKASRSRLKRAPGREIKKNERTGGGLKIKPPTGTGGGGGGGGGVASVSVTTLDQYYDLWDDIDYDVEEYAGGLDYNGEE